MVCLEFPFPSPRRRSTSGANLKLFLPASPRTTHPAWSRPHCRLPSLQSPRQDSSFLQLWGGCKTHLKPPPSSPGPASSTRSPPPPQMINPEALPPCTPSPPLHSPGPPTLTHTTTRHNHRVHFPFRCHAHCSFETLMANQGTRAVNHYPSVHAHCIIL